LIADLSLEKQVVPVGNLMRLANNSESGEALLDG
jgi:hypothetical protein